MIRDDTDDEARKAILCTRRQVEPHVLPAWVAEMDYALAPVIEEALVDAVRTGITGYPSFDDGGELGPAYAPQLDLDGLAALFRAGARTLLTQPHNPWGRVFTRPELEEIRDVVVAHGARGISDEIHAPLVLPGAEHVSYLAIAGTADHAIALVAASKAFNTPGARVRPVRGARRRHPRPAPRRRDGPQRLLVEPGRGRLRGGVHPRRRVAGRTPRAARRAARAARGPARRAPRGGTDASARGHLPGLAGPADMRAHRLGRRSRWRRAGSGSRPATTTTWASTVTSGSPSRPRRSG